MTESRKLYMRTYARVWVANRRKQFFAGKSCVRCGSVERLELDHIDPALKVASSIWTWALTKRLDEIKKCQILCHECHKQKSILYCKELMTGKPNLACRKLDNSTVSEIRDKLAAGIPERAIAAEYKIGKTTVHTIKTNELYQQPSPEKVVGVAGTDPAASRSQAERSSRLSYTP
jgi:hypothetical protein